MRDEALAHSDDQATTGVLLVQLGTPDAPTPSAVRRFLREFLWDPRVVDYPPRPIWWLKTPTPSAAPRPLREIKMPISS